MPLGGSAIGPFRRDVRPCSLPVSGRDRRDIRGNECFRWIKGELRWPACQHNRQAGPVVAEGRAADQLRDHLADRRRAQVAAGIPFRLPRHDLGRGPGPARLAPLVVQLLDQPAAPRGRVLAYTVAAAETLIAVAVIIGFARKITYISAAAFSVLIWAVAEGFGGPYTSGASDIGTAIIYAVFFMGLLALMAYTGPARYSVDYYLEQKISWWWKIAEIRRPVQDIAAPAARPSPPSPPPARQPSSSPSPGQPSRPPARPPSRPFR
jgi:uncharacterized membrane protein YphA (DoxX/SURF4 family)